MCRECIGHDEIASVHFVTVYQSEFKVKIGGPWAVVPLGLWALEPRGGDSGDASIHGSAGSGGRGRGGRGRRCW